MAIGSLLNGCAGPWQPALAQLTEPARTRSSRLACSGTAFHVGASVEWQCMHVEFGNGLRMWIVSRASASDMLR